MPSDAGPFLWVHLWRITAIVLAAGASVGALSAASPVPTADAGAAHNLEHFFNQPWSPQTSDAEKLGTAYVYDEDGNLLSEIGTGGPNSTGTTDYIYLPTANGPMPIAAVINGQIFAIHSDHLNTPRRIDNAQGQTVWQWAYSAFGDTKPTTAHNRFANLDITPNPGTTGISEVVFNLRYPGHYYDKESGLFDNWNRNYSPDRGRYTQSDPIGLGGGWNRVGYAYQNPLMFTDPMGLATFTFTGGGSFVAGIGGEGSAGVYFSNKPNDIGIVLSGGTGGGANVGLSAQLGYVPGALSNVSGLTKNYNASCGIGSLTWMTDPKTGDFSGGSIGPAGRLGGSATDAETHTLGLRDGLDWLFNKMGGIK